MKNHKLALSGGTKVRTAPFRAHPVIGPEEKREVNDVLKTGLLSGFIASPGEAFLGGPKVRRLEEDVKKYFGVKYAVSVNSATAGLHASIAALDIGPGDEVIVSPYTMSASASAILMANAVPVFADIEEDTCCIDPEDIEKKITARTRAIVVVQLFGQSADMGRIMKIAKKHKLAVIEDVAQSPGATYKRKYLGTIGDAGVLSLNQHKTITTGEGGMILTNSLRVAEKARLVRNHGEVIVGKLGYKDISNTLGWNYRMTELEAAVGVAQFKKLNFLNTYRIELAEYLTSLLKKENFPGITLPAAYPGNKNVYFSYPLRFKEKESGISRKVFVAAVKAEGIPLGEGYVKPIYLEPMYQKRICFGKRGYPFNLAKNKVSYKRGICPVAERMHYKELITTGLCRYPHKKKDIKDIVSAFRKVFDHLEDLKNLKVK